ncbi:vascular cell adhesion protein 1 [Engraulis encrasicolus]|uniref:vascular cell adhesion protein 1 n=1 Tax=Engraulis encrasicolus TaxID=184585 RepID=UPI002FD113E5
MRVFLAMLVPVTVCCFGVKIDKLSPTLLEFQKTMELNCSVTGCPPGQSAVTWRTLNDQPFKPVKEEYGFLSFKSPALTNLELVCTATCATAEKVQKNMRILVYSFPSDPEIIGGDNLTSGVANTLTCTARAIYPEDVSVEWLKDDEIILEDGKPNTIDGSDGTVTVISTHTFTPTAQEKLVNITCKVILNIYQSSSPIIKTSTKTMDVNHYTIGEIDISGQHILSVGETLTLTCNSKGHPPPIVLWTMAGEVLNIRNGSTLTIKNITWSHAGQYDCEAHNIAGRVNSSATVTIQGPPTNAQVQVHPSLEAASGENATIICFAQSIPPPTFTLHKQGSGQLLQSSTGTFHLLHLTQEDAGLYLVNITNHWGHVTETFMLSITSSSASSMVHTVVLPAVGSVSFLTASLLLLRFLRSRKRPQDIGSGIGDIVEDAL